MGDVAGIYCRLSLAAMGDTTKVDDQERICRQLAAARGWTVPDEFVWKDNNKSAWRIDVRRPRWEAMLGAVRAGRLRNLIVYHGDRMVRQPYDLEVLIRLASGGVTITSPTGTRRLDVAEDVFVLGILANVARLESENISRRKKAGFARMARAGVAPVPAGRFGRGFGYEADGRTIVAAEAAALQEAAALVLAGESLNAIAAALAARGVTAVSGQPVTRDHLRRILIRPRIAGLLADGSPGTWEPVLDRATWEMVCGTLRTRALSFNPHPTPRARHLLSGIAECGLCGSRLQRTTTRAGLAYACFAPGCRRITRSMAHLDAYVTGRTVRRLSSPALARALAAPVNDPAAAEIIQLEARRAETRKVAENLAAHPGADLAMLTAAVESFTAKIGELRATAQGGAARRVLAAHQGVTREQFAALPLHIRRALVAGSFRVEVLPAGRRNGPGFSPAAVRLTPTG